MSRRLAVKIVGVLIFVMILIMSIFTVYFVRWRSANMYADLQTKGKILAVTGAASMEQILSGAVSHGRFSLEEIFDSNYRPVPGTNPQKYTTKYDAYLEKVITPFEDSFLKDDEIIFAVLVDRNGYLPAHNSKFALPQSGDIEKDTAFSRTKRIFNDPVGLAAAKNDGEVLIQDYKRDTGEKMLDISVPIRVQGKHWGAYRIGFSTTKIEERIAELRKQIIGAMLMMLILSSATIIAVVTLAIPGMILAETSLSFLGIGLRPPVVSWGVLLQEAQNIRSIANAPWLFLPGLAVVIAVLALNFLGDGLRDAADPYS